MKGGARVRSGPAADPSAVQPEEFTELPASRQGEPPAWPITPRPNRFEKAQWIRVWGLPQAIEWEKRNLEVDVAIYVRTMRRVVPGTATPALLAEFRRQGDYLGLTIPGYRAAKFTPQVNAKPTTQARATGTDGAPPRWRPEVIDGSGR